MEPIVFAMGLATGLCVAFLIYGVWVAFRDGKIDRRDVRDQDDRDA